jgi:hypothetical protein
MLDKTHGKSRTFSILTDIETKEGTKCAEYHVHFSAIGVVEHMHDKAQIVSYLKRHYIPVGLYESLCNDTVNIHGPINAYPDCQEWLARSYIDAKRHVYARYTYYMGKYPLTDY